MPAKRPNALAALSVVVLVGGLLFWWVNAIPNEDPLWFLRSFTARADWITLYWDGTTHMFFPGDPEYEEIMTSFSDAIAHWSGYENGVGLSEENLERYRSSERMLELHYNQPIRVHTRHLFSKARFFWIPLSGTHANWRRVFAGLQDQPRIGVLNLGEARFDTLLTAAQNAADKNQP